MLKKEPITIAITGASGVQYGLRLIDVVASQGIPIYLLISKAALMVLAVETDSQLSGNHKNAVTALEDKFGLEPGLITMFAKEDWMSPVASGSGAPSKMVICPCSTGTLSAVANGASDNLIERAADVVLKERNQLVMVVRETPLSSIHLKNMLTLSEMGAIILPASPGFYNNPKTIEDMVDFVVFRILKQLKLPSDLIKPWGQVYKQ